MDAQNLSNCARVTSPSSDMDLLKAPAKYRSPFVDLGYDLFLVILRHISGEDLDSAITTDGYRFLLPFAVCSRHHYAWVMQAIRGLSLLPLNFTFDSTSRRRSHLPTHVTRVPPFPTTLLPLTSSSPSSLSNTEPSSESSQLVTSSPRTVAQVEEKARNGWSESEATQERTLQQMSPLSRAEASVQPLRVMYPDPLLNERLPRAVARLPSLRILHLFRNSEINDAALHAVAANAPGLQELRIRTARMLSVKGLEALRTLPKLHTLDLSYCHNLGDECSGLLASLPALRVLMVAYWDLSDEGVQIILESDTLRSLSLTACPRITKVSCDAVTRRNQLTTLRLRSSLSLKDEAIASFASCSSLTSLDLSLSRRIGDDGIKRMLSPALHQLSNHSQNANVMEETIGVPNLQSLNLSHCSQFTDETAMSIARHPSLTSVDLSFCHYITDRTAEILAQSPCIETLDLSGTSITDEGVEFLSSLPCLRRLNLARCNSLTYAALRALSTRRTPLKVDLRGCQAISSCALLQFSTSHNRLTFSIDD